MKETVEESLKAHLLTIYPEHDPVQLTGRLIEAFWPNGTLPANSPRAPSNALWSERDSIVITYGDTFRDGKRPPLDLLHEFLENHLDGTITGVHILPFYPFSSDDGFAVIDYTKVNSTLGEWDQIETIASDFKLMADLVLNHASSRCAWFDQFRSGQAPGRDYFVTADPESDHSLVVRPRPSELLKPVETVDGLKHVWCTFGHDQVDLNFSNPEVLCEFVRILRLYIDKGVRIVRLDAVAFLWKEPQSSCLHLPQTHELIRLLRTLVNFDSEEVVLLTETNVPNEENLTYFGNQNEAHAIYNFSLPPLMVHGLLAGTSDYLKGWMMRMPPAPEGCAYLNFIAGHDGIGMRPSDGLLPEEERVKMVDAIKSFGGLISTRPGRKGNVRPYELNIALFDALKGTLEGPDEFQLERFLCSQTIMMSLEGIPAFYIHSLLATENDYELREKRNHNRSINRHAWAYDEIRTHLSNPESTHATVFKELTRQIRIRASQTAFHPNATQFTLQLGSALFGFWRQSRDRQQSIFVIANMTAEEQAISLTELNLISGEGWTDLLTGWTASDLYEEVRLRPYQCLWLTNRPGS
ncbi:MAG: sugar phosphorylase [Filomicrobium sp.]